MQRELSKGFYNIVAALTEAGLEALFELLVYASQEDIELAHAGSKISSAKSLGASKMPPNGPSKPTSALPLTPVTVPATIPSPSASSSTIDKQLQFIGSDNVARWIVELTDLEFFEKIGQGGYGAVFRGAVKRGGDRREVAVKKLIFRDEEQAKEFRNEFQLMSKLKHSNIVAFVGVCVDGSEMCIITEFCAKGNVAALLKSTPDLSWPIKLKMALDSARGMAYLHSLRPPIVHRDLKSTNLLVDKEWFTKIADFGLSKASSGQSMNSRMGSLNWCAPEILLQSSAYSPEADSYSFGLVLWEFLTHTIPYAGMSPLQIVRTKDKATMPAIPPGVHKDYGKLITDCCEPKPKHRPSFANMVERLEGFVASNMVALKAQQQQQQPTQQS